MFQVELAREQEKQKRLQEQISQLQKIVLKQSMGNKQTTLPQQNLIEQQCFNRIIQKQEEQEPSILFQQQQQQLQFQNQNQGQQLTTLHALQQQTEQQIQLKLMQQNSRNINIQQQQKKNIFQLDPNFELFQPNLEQIKQRQNLLMQQKQNNNGNDIKSLCDQLQQYTKNGSQNVSRNNFNNFGVQKEQQQSKWNSLDYSTNTAPSSSNNIALLQQQQQQFQQLNTLKMEDTIQQQQQHQQLSFQQFQTNNNTMNSIMEEQTNLTQATTLKTQKNGAKKMYKKSKKQIEKEKVEPEYVTSSSQFNTSHVPINMINNLTSYLIDTYKKKIPCSCSNKEINDKNSNKKIPIIINNNNNVKKEEIDYEGGEEVEEKDLEVGIDCCQRCLEFQKIISLKKNKIKNIQSIKQIWSFKRIRLLSEDYIITYASTHICHKKYRSFNNRYALMQCLPAFFTGVRDYKKFWKLI